MLSMTSVHSLESMVQRSAKPALLSVISILYHVSQSYNAVERVVLFLIPHSPRVPQASIH